MKVSIHKWGNSFGLRVPKALADDMGIKERSQVNISLKDGFFVVTPVTDRRTYSLKTMLK